MMYLVHILYKIATKNSMDYSAETERQEDRKVRRAEREGNRIEGRKGSKEKIE